MDEELEKLKWADKVLLNPSEYTAEEVAEATKLAEENTAGWDNAFDEWDAIADIEDDAEREEALAKWREAGN